MHLHSCKLKKWKNIELKDNSNYLKIPFLSKNNKYSSKYSLNTINSKKVINNFKNSTHKYKNNTKNYKNNINSSKLSISHKKTSNPKHHLKNKADLQINYLKNLMMQSQEYHSYRILIKLTQIQVFLFIKKCYNKKWF